MALAISGVSWSEWVERYGKASFSGTPVDGMCQRVWLKDQPWYKLQGMSQREFLIWISEEVVKPRFGKQHFGQLLKRELDKSILYGTYVCSDGGFTEELEPFIIDPEWTVAIVRLHRTGCTFEGDSRNYIEYLGINIPQIDIHNNGDISNAVKEVSDFIKTVKGE
jgi:hypothetical protein